MIARIRGTLLEKESDRTVVEAGGLGYLVHLPSSVAVDLPEEGDFVDLFVRHIVREDAQALYGFTTAFQRQLFDLLTEVKGCGPRISIALIGELGEQEIIRAIQSRDIKSLCRANGIGARMAERIVVELKDKVQAEWLYEKSVSTPKAPRMAEPEPFDDLAQALIALGYKKQEAVPAADRAREHASGLADQLRQALLILRK